MRAWIPPLALLLFLVWIQLGITSLLPAPYDHVPLLMLLGLYAFISLENVWGMVFLLSQGALDDLVGLSGFVALPMAVVIGVTIILTLRTVMTHRSMYAVFVVSFFAVFFWEAGLFAWSALQTERIMAWVGEWLTVALLSGVLVVGMHLLFPRWRRRITQYIRLPQ